MSLRRLLEAQPIDPFHQEELRRTLVGDLYRRSATTFWFLMPALFLFRAILGEAYEASPGARASFAGTVAMLMIRYALVLHRLRRPMEDTQDVHASYLRFHVVSLVLGLGLAGTLLFAGPQLTFTEIALASVFLTGVHSVALGGLAASPITYAFYINPALLGVIYLVWSRPPSPHQAILIGMIAIYIPVLSMMCYYNHDALRRTILLGLTLRDLALKDVLTGLRNRRFLTEFMETEVEQVRRSWRHGAGGGQSLGLIILDLDHFKAVNDEHGHAAGDEVLRQVAVVLQETVRRPDLVVRWGGEEFVVVARDLERESVGDLAGRIRRQIETHGFRLPSRELLSLTGSLGFSVFPFSTRAPDLVGWEQALTLADHALYQAKQAGRNRVIGLVAGEADAERGEELLRAVKEGIGGAAIERRLIRLVPEARR